MAGKRLAILAGTLALVCGLCAAAYFAALAGQSFFNVPLRSAWYPAAADGGRDAARLSFLLNCSYFSGRHLTFARSYDGGQMIFAHRLRPAALSFDFYWNGHSAPGVFFDMDADGFAGFCLSPAEALPSFWFRADADGRFYERGDIAPIILSFSKKGWFRIRVEFRDRHTDVYCGHKKLFQAPIAPRKEAYTGFFGFYGRKVKVDNVRVRASDGREFFDNFRNDAVFVPLFVCFSAFFGLLALGLWGRLPPSFAPGSRLAATALFFFAAAALLFFWLRASGRARDRVPVGPDSGLSRFSPAAVLGTDKAAALSPAGRMAAVRWFDFMRASEKSAGEQAGAEAADVTIVFAGARQAAGALFEREDFVRLCEKRLNAVFAGRGVKVACIAIDEQDGAGRTDRVLDELRKRCGGGLNPDICVFNLGSGDFDPSAPDRGRGALREGLEELFAFNRDRGALCIAALEAVCPDPASADMKEVWAEMDSFASARGLDLLDFHGFLGSHLAQGLLWWDRIRLRPVGQKIAAEFFCAKLEPLIADLLAARSTMQ